MTKQTRGLLSYLVDEAGAEMAIEVCGRKRGRLEEPTHILSLANICHSLSLVFEGIGFVQRGELECTSLLRLQKRIDYLLVFYLEYRTGGIDQLASGLHATRSLLQ